MERLNKKELIEHNRAAQQDGAYDGFELDAKDALIPGHCQLDWSNAVSTKFGKFRLVKRQKHVIKLAWNSYRSTKIKDEDIPNMLMWEVGMCVDAFWYECDMDDFNYSRYSWCVANLAERINKALYGKVRKQ